MTKMINSMLLKLQENWLKRAISTTLVVAIVFVAGGFTLIEEALAVSNLDNVYRLTFTGAGNQNVDGATDNMGNVHAVYERDGTIYYKQDRYAEEAVAAGTNPAIDIDSTGAAHVAFISSGTLVKYTTRTSSGWQPAEDLGTGTQVDIDVDGSDKVHIALTRDGLDGFSDILYISNTSGAFNTATPDTVKDGQDNAGVGTNYTNPTIKVDGSGNYHIACLNTSSTGDPVSSGKYVEVVTNAAEGSSTSPNLGYSLNNILGRNSLILDGTTAIVSFVADVNAVYLAKVTTNNTWDTTTVAPGSGEKPTLALNGSNLGVAYEYNTQASFAEDTGSGYAAPSTIDASGKSPVLVANGTDRFVYFVKSGDVYLASDKVIADTAAPIVIGVTEGATYTAPVTITYYDNEGLATAILDSAAFASGDTVSTNGAKTLVVTDEAGNTTTVHFTMNLPVVNFGYIYRITFTGAGNQNVDGATDNMGNVHAVYERDGTIYYKQDRYAEEAVAAGTNPAIDIDSTGAAHVAFISSGTLVKYTTRTSSGWQPAEDLGTGTQVDIDVDGSDKVHIALTRDGLDGFSDILYISNTSGAFNTATPDTVKDGQDNAGVGTNYTNPTIKVDGSGNYHIACLNTSSTGDPVSSGKYVEVVTNAAEGSSTSPNLGYSLNNILGRNSLILDGTTAIVSFVADVNAVYLAKVTTNNTWDTTTVAPGSGEKPTLALNGSNLGVAYEYNTQASFAEDTGSGYAAPSTIDASGKSPVLVANGTDRFVYFVKSGDVYLASDKVIADTAAPIVIGVTEGATYTAPVTITYYDNEGLATAILDSAAFASGDTVSTNGAKTLVVTDEAGNTTTVHFTMNMGSGADTTGPVVVGVSEGGVYTAAVTITFSDPSGIGSATLNGTAFASGDSVSTNGAYTLIVADTLGNTTTVNFTMNIGSGADTTPPTVTGVSNGQTYYSPVTITYSDPSGISLATLNGSNFASGTTVSANGNYTLIVRDVPGNQVTINFTMNISYGGGGGGGGGGPSDPTVTALNVPLTINPEQRGILIMNFDNGCTLRLEVPQYSITERTTFNAVLEELGNRTPVADHQASLICGVANVTAVGTVSRVVPNSFLNALTLTLTMSPALSDKTNAGLYKANDELQEWNLRSDASFEPSISSVTLISSEKLGRYAAFRVVNLPLIMKYTGEVEGDNGQVLGATLYPAGTLLRTPDHKVYVVTDEGCLKHIKTLAELRKYYSNREIIDISYEEFALQTVCGVTPVIPNQCIPEKAGYGDGELIRCSDRKIYLIKCGKKKHVKSRADQVKYFFGVKINNVSDCLVSAYNDYYGNYGDVCAFVEEGSLIRGTDMKVYLIKDGRKYHISTLRELASKFFGVRISNVSDDVINSILDY